MMHYVGYLIERCDLSNERCFQFSTPVTIYEPGLVHPLLIFPILILPNVHT